jgi:lipopolysaccharide transport system permease protein
MANLRLPHIVRLSLSPASAITNHLHLVSEFVAKDVRGRFAGSIAGMVWALIHPIATIGVYLFVFSIVLRVQVTMEETGTGSFGLFFLTGFFPWLLFADGVSRSVGCLVDNANLITKVVFPVELLPVSVVLSAFVINGIGMSLFLMYLAVQGYLHLSWLVLLMVLPLQFIFTWGFSSFVAGACVFVRDVRELLGVVLMAWFFATPVIYPLSMAPKGFRDCLMINPMGLFVGVYRDALLRHDIAWESLLYILVASLVSYGLGSWFLMRVKPAFGDVL